MNEFELIANYFTRPARSLAVKLGVGDDAALLVPTPGHLLVASTDMLVAGRHFFLDVDPEALGHKALAVNLSDMAAMGATPRWAMLAGALPDAEPAWLEAFARGFFTLADRFSVDLVGGDTTCGPLNLCVTILGEVPVGAAITRSGAQVGDDIYVSGQLGSAALALAALCGRLGADSTLEATALAAGRDRLERPAPRVALGIRLRGIATAMLDVSDGLTGDLGHILHASNVGAVVDLTAIPCAPALAGMLNASERARALDCLLAGGDDYELCFTADRGASARIAAIADAAAVPLTRIGAIAGGGGLVVRDEWGAAMALPQAFDHFADTRA